MDQKEQDELISRYLKGQTSPQENLIVENLYNQLVGEQPDFQHTHDLMSVRNKIYKGLPVPEVKPVPNGKPLVYKIWPRVAVAAAAVAAITLGIWLYYAPRHLDTETSSAQAGRDLLNYVKNDIAPGKQGATLTLANGKKIVLSSVSNEELEKQAGPNVAKTEGTLGYTVYPPLSALGATDDYHTLSTAKGETYRVGLPDGSIVWLNAESSLKYPASFVNRDKRNVTLRGEAYFEIARDKMHPFVVETDKQKVEVLGTHFNINAYEDHGQVRTTLLEGSVSVRHADPEGAAKQTISASRNRKTDRGPHLRQDDDRFRQEAIILKPGQQSILANNRLKISPADTEETVAWKNGYFRFNNEDITSIMSKLSRWYNIDVKFGDELPTVGFYGTISRFKNISEVLEMLEQTKGVHFKIEGRRVTVMK